MVQGQIQAEPEGMPAEPRRRHGFDPVVFGVAGAIAVAFVVWGGLVMITAPAAQAAPVPVCHATNSDSNPYNDIKPAQISNHGPDHDTEWGNRGAWWHGEWHAPGSPKPEIMSTDIPTGADPAEYCNAPAEAGPRPVTPEVNITQPDCDNGNRGSWTSTVLDGVTYSPPSGEGAPGEPVTVTVTLEPGYELAPGARDTFSWTFGPAEADCDGTGGGDDDPIQVTPLEPSWIEATCDTDPSVDYTEVTGVVYDTGGSVTPLGTATVTAAVLDADDYVFAPGVVTSWEHTFLAKPTGSACDETSGGGGQTPGGGGGTDTPTNVTPLEPSWTEPTCSTPAGVEYRSVEGVAYRTEGDVAPGSRVVVRAEALDGHSFADGTVTWWAHTFDTPQRCGGGDTDGGGDDGGEPNEGVTPSPTVKGVQKFRPPAGKGDNVQPGTAGPHAVPTAVAAGLTDLSGGHGSPSTFSSPQLAQALVAGGLLLLVVGGGLGLGRRTNGAHEF